jgi:hypothetical protein
MEETREGKCGVERIFGLTRSFCSLRVSEWVIEGGFLKVVPFAITVEREEREIAR